MFVFSTLASILVAGCETAPAPVHFDMQSEPWTLGPFKGTHIATDHFDIYSTLMDKQFEQALPGFLEAAHREYTGLLPPPPDSDKRLQTYVFNTRRQWERFAAARFPRLFPVYQQISAGGFAHGNVCVVYYILRPYTLSVLAHEGMHQYFADHFAVPLPAWLNEGLATYCESFEFSSGSPVFTPQHNTFRLNDLRDALSTDTVLPLREMLATDAGKVIVQGRSRLVKTYYAQAWAMTVFLQHGADGKYAAGFSRLLADITSGELPVIAQAAKISAPSPSQTSYGEAVFRAYITTDLPLFEQELRAFMFELAGFKQPPPAEPAAEGSE